MRNKNSQINKAISEGIKRIDEIKNKISSYRQPKLAKAQVYEMWSDVFGSDD